MVVDLTAIDPELRKAARVLPRGFALHRGLTLPRAFMKAAGRVGQLRSAAVHSVNADVTVRVHRPVNDSRPGPALLWIHGGGTVMGSAAQDDKFSRRVVRRTDVAVAAVDHRLAPEHPYPTPLEDCYAALTWLIGQPWVDPTKVAIGGASAGGGLTAALAQLARDRGEFEVAHQVLVYPMLDDRTGRHPDGASRVMWSERDNQIAWQWYLGGADPVTGAPGRRDDLRGLPPAWIGVGTADLFHDESVSYARRLIDAGVAVQLEIAPGAFHAFDSVAPNAAVSQRFFTSQCQSLRTTLVDNPQ